MANYGIRIALPGEDSRTADDKDLVFSSKFNTFKVFMSGVKSITTNGSGVGTGTVDHNLGYSPTFQVFRKGTASWQRENASEIDSSSYTNAYFPNPGSSHNWISYNDTFQVSSSTTQLVFNIEGANNTTYNFAYYIFADLAQEYSSNTGKGTNDYGIRIAQTGEDALLQKEYQLGFSSRFRSIPFNHVKSGTITLSLPLLFGSAVSDPDPEEGVYAEITHGMGYPPFFLAYVKSGSGDAYEIPVNTKSPYLDLGYDYLEYVVDSWCDATRLRFSFWRKAYYSPGDSWSAETITIKYLLFNEDLSLLT